MSHAMLKRLVPFILIASTVYPVGKDGLGYASPFVLMGIRYVLGAAILLLIAGKTSLNRSVVYLAAGMSSSTLLWILGLQYISAGDSAVLSYTMPFISIIGASAILGERATRNEIVGSLIGLSGTAIYAIPLYHGLLLAGAVLTFGGAVAWAIYAVYLRKLRHEDQNSVVGTAFALGSIPFVLGAIPFHFVDPTPEFFADALYLALIGGVLNLLLLSSMVRVERVGLITRVIFFVPAVTLAIQFAETLSVPGPLSLFGCCIMFAGIYITGAGMAREEEKSG